MNEIIIFIQNPLIRGKNHEKSYFNRLRFSWNRLLKRC